MSAYILLILGTVIVCGVLTSLLPAGKMQTSIKGIAKLACVLTIVSPIANFFIQGKSGDNDKNFSVFFSSADIETDDRFIEYYSELRIRQTADSMKTELAEQFGIPIVVELDWEIEEREGYLFYDERAIKIYKVHIQTQTECSEEVKRRMSDYVKEKYCSEVLIE